jgi:hypothetical protein
MTLSDLTVETFLILRAAFFYENGTPKPFNLRDKRDTQDDPLDVHIASILADHLQNAVCQRAPGSLTSPDMP